jgi:hypothetical protein
MEWTRSETVALATNKCVYCQGLGLKAGQGRRRLVPCKCVFREIFRICYKKFRKCVERESHLSHVSGEVYSSNGQRRLVWSRKVEEYMADFYLVAKRTLDEDEWQVFSAHYLLGADWKLCCAQLRLDKGNFFHQVYRVQEKLGRAFREVSPYALFPLDEYFKTTIRSPYDGLPVWEGLWAQKVEEDGRKVVPIRPPLQPKAPQPSAPQPNSAAGPRPVPVLGPAVRSRMDHQPSPLPKAA